MLYYDSAHLVKVLAKDGLEIDYTLGNGAFAKCWAIKGKSFVAKMTGDENEMEAVARLLRCNTPMPGIVNIFAAKMVGNNLLEYSERLYPITDEQDRIFGELQFGCIPLVDNDLPTRIASRIRSVAKPSTPWESAKPVMDFFGLLGRTMALNIKGMRDSLKTLGCTSTCDIHHSNIMNRKGYGLVVSDLGLTSWTDMRTDNRSLLNVA